jgi:excisionase family DNA binding protein
MSEFWNDPNDKTTPVTPPPSTKAANVISATDDEALLTSAQAAKLLKLSEKGLRGMAQKGRISHFKLGREYRFRKDDLFKMMLRVEAANK